VPPNHAPGGDVDDSVLVIIDQWVNFRKRLLDASRRLQLAADAPRRLRV
jgi:hypothetical protein